MMSLDHHLPHTTTAASTEPSALASFWSSVRSWIETCADYYAASATYEQLSRLSDAELQRRGLSRDTLAREVFKVCERRD